MDPDRPAAGRGGLNPTSQTFHPNDWLNRQFSQRNEEDPAFTSPVDQASYGHAGEQSWSAVQCYSRARDFFANNSLFDRGYQQTRYPFQSLPANIDPALLEHNSAPMGFFGSSTSPSSTPTNGLSHQVPMNPNSFEHANPGYGGYAKPQRIPPLDIRDETFPAWLNTSHGPASEQHGGFQNKSDQDLARAFDRYDPTAEPFTPTNVSSVPSRLPLPEPSFDHPGNSNDPEDNLHGPIGQDTTGTSNGYIAAAQPFTSLGGASVLSGTHPAEPARKRRGQPSKNATAIAQNVRPTSQPANLPGATSMKWVFKKKSKYTDVAAVIPQMQSAVEKIKERSDIDMLPDPQNLLPSGLYFSNANEAALANWIRFWESPANDETIPITQSDMEAWVHRLVDAMFNEQGCLRTNSEQESKSHINRWSAGAQFYRRTAIEAAAWRLVQLAKDVHQVGWHEPIAEPKLRKDIYQSMDFTFLQRMQLVERVLQLSKTTCDALIKGNRFHELVGCPQVLFERTHDNEHANRLKKEQLSTVKANKAQPMKSAGDQPAASSTKDNLGQSVTKRKLAETDEGTRSEAHASPSRQTTRFAKMTTTTRIDDRTSTVDPVNAGYPEVPSDIEEPLYAPPVDQDPTLVADLPRPVKAAKGTVSAAGKKSSSVDTSRTTQKRGRAVEDTESEDEAPDASRKRRKLQGRDLIAAQTVAQPSTSQHMYDENETDFSSAPTRGRTASKVPRRKQTGRKPARPHGGV